MRLAGGAAARSLHRCWPSRARPVGGAVTLLAWTADPLPHARARPRGRGGARGALDARAPVVRRRPAGERRGPAGPRPAARPDAATSSTSGVSWQGQLREQVRRRAAQHRPAPPRDRGAVDGAAQAAGARPLGRAAPAPLRRAGRPGRPLRLHRAGPPRPATTARSAPTSSCTWPAVAASWSTRRCRSTPSSTPPRTDDPDEHAGHLRRHARQLRAHVGHAVRQGLLAGAAGDAGVRGAVRARRGVPVGRPRRRARPDRAGR